MANPHRKLVAGSYSADISAALEKARTELVAAEAAVVVAEQKYDDALLEETPAALRKLADAKQDAAIETDRCRAVIAKLERQLEAATSAEAECTRQAAYDRAKELTEAAQKKLQRDYPKAAMAIREVLANLAEAELAVRAANDDLPAGASRLDGPEAGRSRPNLYKEAVAETTVELWAPVNSPYEPIADHLQSQVQVREVGRRIRGRYDDGTGDDGETTLATVFTDTGGSIQVAKRKFIRRVFLPDQSGHFASSLASTIELPAAVAGGKPFWSASDSHPSHVHALASAPLPKIEKSAERTSMVEYIPVE